jgi:hypothetical protein
MNFLPLNTLAAIEAMPQKRRINLSTRKTAHFSAATKAYRENCNQVSPDVSALEFYAANHYAAKLSNRFTLNEPLPDWAAKLADAYQAILEEQAERMMHYLVSIITREIRHLDSKKLTELKSGAIATGGDVMYKYVRTLLGKHESAAVGHYMTEPPECGIGPYVRTIEYLFDMGWPEKTAYGGKAWGAIARCLGDFVYGKISLEMMVDTAYTLAHNNGPIFNKGMMYQGYTSEFKKLLDVQRGGQIPELLKTREEYSWMKQFKTAELCKLNDLAYANMPEEFGEYVDWIKIKELGALSHLTVEIAEQNKKHPKPVPPKIDTFFGKKVKKLDEKKFAVTDDEYVTTFSREAA